MPEAQLIFTLVGGLGAALLLGYLTHRLGLSPIAGYLVAGVVVGPHTPGFVADPRVAEQLADVGVVLLMFGVGLQFHVEELLAVRRVAIPGAIAGVTVAALLGMAAAMLAGWQATPAATLGLSLSVASTVVLVRILADRRELHTATGHIAIGWLVMEDLLTVFVLVLLPTLAAPTTASHLAVSVVITFGKMAALIAVFALGGTRLLPALLDRVAATRSRELFTLTVLVIALGLALGSAMLFGVSMALGAFVAGMVVGRSDYAVRAASDALPMRDAFAVLFFVSIGMLLDPGALFADRWLVLAALLIVMVAKPLVAATLLALMRYPLRVVLAVPAALAQIGEFSFIMANLERSLGIVPESAVNIVVAVSIASIVINPLVVRGVRRAERWLQRAWAARATRDGLPDEGASSSLDPGGRAVVIGYGPTGRTVARLLADNAIAPTVVELNIDAVRQLHAAGLSAVYGDARQPTTLVSAGVRHASTLIVSSGDDGEAIIAAARQVNPTVRIAARVAYLRELAPVRRAGADEVFAGEGEVALAMTEAVLRRLGATPDQIDRERERVREELFGQMPQAAPTLVPQPPDQEKPKADDAAPAAVAQPPEGEKPAPIPPV
jgi:CPA2 family monovalent cation:H+ antiporter-2